jgi:hypothetical protein
MPGKAPFTAHVATWRSWWTHKLAAHLIGTADSIPSAAQELGHPDWEEDFDAHELDSLAFECTNCNWWHGAEECNDHPKTGQWICDECMREVAGD